jgi:hypothetical protein
MAASYPLQSFAAKAGKSIYATIWRRAQHFYKGGAGGWLCKHFLYLAFCNKIGYQKIKTNCTRALAIVVKILFLHHLIIAIKL